MSLFYFLVEDGTFAHAPERIDLPTLDAARLHAATLSQRLIAEGQGRFARGEAWQLRVTDESGFVCFALQFTAASAQMAGLNSYLSMAANRFGEGEGRDEVAPPALI